MENKFYESVPLDFGKKPGSNAMEKVSGPRKTKTGPSQMTLFAEIEIGGESSPFKPETLPAERKNHFVPEALQAERKNFFKPEVFPAPRQPAPPPANAVPENIRSRFAEMRQIARDESIGPFDARELFYQRAKRMTLSRVFYKQAVFMRDFEDNYTEKAYFSSYFPYYQLMDISQLRTYFTWRAQVRAGRVDYIFLSYAYLYIYELLNNITPTPARHVPDSGANGEAPGLPAKGGPDAEPTGPNAESPGRGLRQLVEFWRAYRFYDAAIDKHVLRWLKDYHIYYGLPQPFGAFIRENGLEPFYPKAYPAMGRDEIFDLYAGFARYDIRKSAYYGENNRELIAGCFHFVMEQLYRACAEAGLCLDKTLFKTSQKKIVFPFDGALFFYAPGQPSRRVILSENEIYFSWQSEFFQVSAADGSRGLVGYIFRQIESILRAASGYKYKLTASAGAVEAAALRKMQLAGLALEKIIGKAAAEFYTRFNRTVVDVDIGRLEKIRRDAQDIQEKLTVSDPWHFNAPSHHQNISDDNNAMETNGAGANPPGPRSGPAIPARPGREAEQPRPAAPDIWDAFYHSLTPPEAAALSEIIRTGEIVSHANTIGIMPEVLIDNLNQKAYDHIGDTIFDYNGRAEIYDEYREPVQEMVMRYGG